MPLTDNLIYLFPTLSTRNSKKIIMYNEGLQINLGNGNEIILKGRPIKKTNLYRIIAIYSGDAYAAD